MIENINWKTFKMPLRPAKCGTIRSVPYARNPMQFMHFADAIFNI